MPRPIARALALAGGMAAVALALAQPAHSAVVRGRVFEATAERAPLGFATVTLTGVDSSGTRVALGTMALRDGTWILAPVPPGGYRLRISRIGYREFSDSLTVARDDTTVVVEAALAVKPVKVAPIVVEADRLAGIRDYQPGFVGLGGETLADVPGIVENDPIRAIQLLPGVQAASDFSSGLYVRGGGPDQTLVLLDDVPVYNPSHAFGFFSTFNGDAIDDVALYRSAYPARYGGRLGAVLDVATRTGRAGPARGRLAITTLAARARAEGDAGRARWSLGARRTYLEPILALLRNADSDIPSYAFYDANARLDAPLAGGTVTASAFAGNDRLDFTLDSDNALSFDWGNTLARAAWKRRVGEHSLVEARASWSRYASTSTFRALTTPFDVDNGIDDFGLVARVRRDAGGAHALEAGLAWDRYRVHYRERFNGEVQADFDDRPNEVAAWVEDAWRPAEGAKIVAGTRVRYIDSGSRVRVEPRLALSRRVGEHWRVRAGGALYHQFLQLVSTEGLSALDFYVPIDESVRLPRAWQASAGVGFEPSRAWTFSMEGYATTLANLVYLNNDLAGGSQPDRASEVFLTGGEGWAAGVELFARRRRGALTGWVGYTLGWSRRRWDALNDGAWFAPKYDRRHDINAVARWERGPWRLGAAFVFGSGQAFTPAGAGYLLFDPATGLKAPLLLPARKNSARLRPYHRLDVSVSRRFSLFGASARWSLDVFNAYSRRNEWFVQYTRRDDDSVDAQVVRMLPIVPSLSLEVDL